MQSLYARPQFNLLVSCLFWSAFSRGLYTHCNYYIIKLYNITVRNLIDKESWWPTQKYLARSQLFTTAVNSSAQFFLPVYTCMYILPHCDNETELILSLWLVQCGMLTSVYLTCKNLLNRDYCRLCNGVWRRGAVTMPWLSPDRSSFSVASYPGVPRAPLGRPGYEASFSGSGTRGD